jgi:hypothetical protein
MGVNIGVPWKRLERWSPIGFMVAGVGFLLSLALLLVGEISAVTVPEIVLSVVVIPSLLALTVFALPGFYPYVADTSPRLALIGGVAGFVAGAVMVFQLVAKSALHVLGIIGFTEDGPLIGLFFLLMFALFLSVLFYGLASVRSGEPSRLVGLLLLVIVVEPGAALLNDVLGFDFGIEVLYVTLGVAGLAMFLIGYSLWDAATASDRVESASEMMT